MDTDTLNKIQDAERINDTRKAELLSTPGRAYRHHQLRRPPDHRCDGQDELHQPRPRARDGHLQPDARGPGLLDHPGHRRLDLGRRLHGPLCRAGEVQHGRRDRRHRRHRSSTWISSKRLATNTTKPMKSLTMIRCARSTSTASTTPISTSSSCRTATTRSARSPTAWSRAPTRRRAFIREMGKWLSEGNAQEAGQPRPARLRA